eukprot:1159555-Pelagomonas_calceolata.AAC.11
MQGLYLFDISPALGGGSVQGQEQGLGAGQGSSGLQGLGQGCGQEEGTRSRQFHHHHHHLQQQQQQGSNLALGVNGANSTGGGGGRSVQGNGGGVQENGRVYRGMANGRGGGGGGGVQENDNASPAGDALFQEGDADGECVCGGLLGSLGPQHGRGSSKRKSSSSSAHHALTLIFGQQCGESAASQMQVGVRNPMFLNAVPCGFCKKSTLSDRDAVRCAGYST